MDEHVVEDPMAAVIASIRMIALSLGVEPTGPEMQNLLGLNTSTIAGVLAGTRKLGEERRSHVVVTAQLLGYSGFGAAGSDRPDEANRS